MFDDDKRAFKRFPASREEWRSAAPVVRHNSNQESLEILDFQVMQSWEIPLMRRMAMAVCPAGGGTILEVGFGLGIAAEFIQECRPVRHVIIEANLALAEAAKQRYAAEIGNESVVVMPFFWEECVEKDLHGCSFSGILFDTFPLTPFDLRRNHFAFFPYARQLLQPGGCFTYFSDEVADLSAEHRRILQLEFPTAKVTSEIVPVSPDSECEYWSKETILHVMVRT